MRNSKKICGQNSVCCFFSLQAIPQYLQVYVLALLPRCKSSLSVGAYSQSTHGMIPVFAGCTALYNFLKKQKMLQSLCLQGFEAPYTTAADRNRTGTGITTHGILSPGRLPVPPLRQVCFGFSCTNGWRWIRTTEACRNRFTVCPLWPLGNPSKRFQEACLFYHSAVRKSSTFSL